MSWNKNIFSYVLWLMYAIIVGTGVIKISETVVETAGYSKGYGFLLSGILCFSVGLIVFVARKVAAKRQEADAKNSSLLIEGIVCGVLVLVGIVLRVVQMQNASGTASDMYYFEAAKVAEGNMIPQMPHGATYIFLQFLHMIFVLLGNKLLAALWFQVILYSLAVLFLYLSVRKLAGSAPALVMAGFLSVSPYMLQKTSVLSPEILCLVMNAMILWLIAEMLKRRDCSRGMYVSGGLLMGVSIYLDLSGLLLMVFLLGIFSMEREEPENIWNERGSAVLIWVLGAVAGWFGAILLKTLLGGNEILTVIKNWMQLYRPKGFSVSTDLFGITSESNSYVILINVIVIYVFLLFGIFSFWINREVEHQGIWIGMVMILLGMQSFQVLTTQLMGDTYLYVGLSVLAGIGISDVFAVNPSWEFDEEVQDTIIIRKGDVIMHKDKNNKNEPKVKYLDNPLPEPKTNHAKVMAEQSKEDDDDFDFKITDDDDFDV